MFGSALLSVDADNATTSNLTRCVGEIVRKYLDIACGVAYALSEEDAPRIASVRGRPPPRRCG
jgi:hypothetical protein